MCVLGGAGGGNTEQGNKYQSWEGCVNQYFVFAGSTVMISEGFYRVSKGQVSKQREEKLAGDRFGCGLWQF